MSYWDLNSTKNLVALLQLALMIFTVLKITYISCMETTTYS